jgi:hypothetical protein
MLKEKFGFYFSTIQVEKECAEIDEASEIDITRTKERGDASQSLEGGYGS